MGAAKAAPIQTAVGDDEENTAESCVKDGDKGEESYRCNEEESYRCNEAVENMRLGPFLILGTQWT